ncbi:MAG TPA: helix-hairpin-helix domain-containing protein [Candidatus Methylomirabilis sp.]|nr:helix-hairpin-helix domain-containing protein [Candidatus Methylomirabilis sp.]
MPINLNSASVGELTQLPRIGADKARRIVRYRALRKGFRNWDDFATTPGLTQEDVKAIRLRAWIGPGPERWRLPPDSRRSGRRPTAVRRTRVRSS